jgi:hypothetical protein
LKLVGAWPQGSDDPVVVTAWNQTGRPTIVKADPNLPLVCRGNRSARKEAEAPKELDSVSPARDRPAARAWVGHRPWRALGTRPH